MTPPAVLDDVEACVDAILARVGRDLRVGLPLGLGKPPELVNALYARAKADPSIRLTLLTALSLEKPVPGSKLEAAFLQPFVDRVFEGVVELDYARDVTARRLPPNVRVLEFFFRPGSRLNQPEAQRDYISTNYTFAARDVFAQGCNVAMQAVARRETAEGVRYSLSCNPDTSLELMAMLRAAEARGERSVAIVGVVNPNLPYMAHDAEVAPEAFDAIVEHPRYASALFSTPKTPVAVPDYAIGLHVSSLIRDGGTLQIGIGALGDAIVHALQLRHRRNGTYREVLGKLGAAPPHGTLVDAIGGLAPFERGLYGATEMFVDGFWHLIRAGIVKRRVYDFWALQQLVDEGALDEEAGPDLSALEALERLGVRTLRTADFEILQHHGFFNDATRYDAGYVVAPSGERVIANVADPMSRAVMAEHCLGSALRNGIVLHAGFFLGPRDFYRGLNEWTQAERDRVCMTGVDRVNQLDRNPRLYKTQRREARFVNTGMLATLGGAVVSDGLADGRVVSGVGGQYNFVAMAHQLPAGRSILMVRAVRQEKGGAATSNIVAHYAHATIPRHLRDLVVTEYGVADLRGQTDAEVAKRLLGIADSRFQPALLAEAQKAGRIEAGYRIPEAHRRNLPEELDRRIGPAVADGTLPPFPFGSDFTPEEETLLRALETVRARAASTPRWRLALKALRSAPAPERLRPYLERMRLTEPRTMEDKAARALLVEALEARA